ncbi:hypothetical protein SPAN111604_05540 [Sphingomonas antarctica]|uniref:hypothetical protein n=1 Tax=Sphingomonas antarctica TaxID=2040274 RepID=UPI0039EAE440
MKIYIAIAALMLSGCTNQPSYAELKDENAELQSQVEQLQSQLSDVRDKADEAQSKVSDLESTVERFSSEDWQNVVPEAEVAVSRTGRFHFPHKYVLPRRGDSGSVFDAKPPNSLSGPQSGLRPEICSFSD